jgi:hypothetical protein
MSATASDELDAIYGAWRDRDEFDAAELISGLDLQWWVVGGRAIEAFTHVRRKHRDVDIAIHARDFPAFHRHVRDRWHVWAVTSGVLQYLAAHQPLPERCDQLWLRHSASEPWEFDVLLNAGDQNRWVSRHNPDLRMHVDEATWTSSRGICYQKPEIVLLFKARSPAVHDQADFEATWPLLDNAQRKWLIEQISGTYPAHPWLK